ncbi:hypothetical protein GCK72_017610 [Caenorhabditis remanei]|uniref:Uncharacterized protein n=1 Tax=Caenorhabditis remanei TaxID=31234 RepID=A0A6A5G7K6_CAERE|nr:hypothetical protein GCK72_017610 [Caenorhabditis remanei]KAF1751058.1 hypothetical protein GCK72_017610 [Caenorhabditis remanei]
MTSVFESVGDYHGQSLRRASTTKSCYQQRNSRRRNRIPDLRTSWSKCWNDHSHGKHRMVMAGLFLIVLGLLTKIGALLSTIPDPLVGGVLAFSMAMVVGVAVSNLQTVDMALSRNMGVFGFSMMFGMIVPKYFTKFPVATGWSWANDILNVLLQMPMFVGALCACILDNTIGGATREQRGLRPRGEIYEGGIDECTYSYPK